MNPTQPRQESPTVDPSADQLIDETRQLADMIDRRIGNPPGTTERAIYLWWWPPTPTTSLDCLRTLHADAVEILHRLTCDDVSPVAEMQRTKVTE